MSLTSDRSHIREARIHEGFHPPGGQTFPSSDRPGVDRRDEAGQGDEQETRDCPELYKARS